MNTELPKEAPPKRVRDTLNVKPIYFLNSETNQISNHSVEWIHSTGKNKWKDWYCSAGLQSLYIDFDGNVFSGTCGVGGWYGNIFREGLAPDNKLNQWIKCTANVCACGSDMFPPKVKRKEQVPEDIQSLYGYFKTPEKFPMLEEAHDTDVVISEVTRRAKLVIWDIGRRCNYSCTYCSPGSHNNYEAHKSLGSLIHAVDALHEYWLLDYPGQFVITGGEPTINPDYIQFVKYITFKKLKNHVHTTTNGSRDSEYFRELIKYSHLTFSGHMEILEYPRAYERFVKNIEVCIESKKAEDLSRTLQVRLMIKPNSLELVKSLVRDLLAIPDFRKHAVVNCDLLHDTDGKGLISYSEEEKQFASTIYT